MHVFMYTCILINLKYLPCILTRNGFIICVILTVILIYNTIVCLRHLETCTLHVCVFLTSTAGLTKMAATFLQHIRSCKTTSPIILMGYYALILLQLILLYSSTSTLLSCPGGTIINCISVVRCMAFYYL